MLMQEGGEDDIENEYPESQNEDGDAVENETPSKRQKH